MHFNTSALSPLDKAFYNDFNRMCEDLKRKSVNDPKKNYTVKDIALPPEFEDKYVVNNNKLVGIYNVDDPLFKVLNNTSATIYKEKDKVPIYDTQRRKFMWKEGYFTRRLDSKGNFMKYRNDKLKCPNPYVEYYNQDTNEFIEEPKVEKKSSGLTLSGILKKDISFGKTDYSKKPIYYYVPVEVPKDSLVIASDYAIGWKTTYKAKEGFGYIDVLEDPSNYDSNFNKIDNRPNKYLYYIPKKYLYYLNQTALALSPRLLPNCYYGVQLVFTNGYTYYLQVVDFKPSSTIKNRDYRYLCSKPGTDYRKELELLRNFWMKKDMLIDPKYCELECSLDEKTQSGNKILVHNLAMAIIEGVAKVDYEQYDLSKSLAGYTEFYSNEIVFNHEE